MDRETDRYWFPAKRAGWGWGFPSRWEGWVVMVGFVGAMIANAVLFAGRQWVVYGVVTVALVGIVVGVCWWKGEPPRWR